MVLRVWPWESEVDLIGRFLVAVRACVRAAGEEGGDGVELAVTGDMPRCCMYAKWGCLDGVLGAERDIAIVFAKGVLAQRVCGYAVLGGNGKEIIGGVGLESTS